MFRKLAKMVLGNREIGEVGYYKRLSRVERNLKKAFVVSVVSIIMWVVLMLMLVTELGSPMEYTHKNGYIDGTGIHYESVEGGDLHD